MRPLWLLGAYHKTGCILAIKLLNLLSGGYVRVQGPLPAPLPSLDARPFRHYWFSPNASSLATLPDDVDYRFVHFARDPAELAVSAYRYHGAAAAGERWLDVRADARRAPPRDAFELAHVRDVPGRLAAAGSTGSRRPSRPSSGGATWRRVLAARDPAAGATLEAFRAAGEIDKMVVNAGLLAADPRALTVRMSGFHRNFAAAAACVVAFLAPVRPGFDAEAHAKRAAHRPDRADA
ncbi:hypothetical protein JL720_8409 [Aureococcus anophagefferens]|nr:hypothetical protein JL720_8409 [Aureococcus anophagefferens]